MCSVSSLGQVDWFFVSIYILWLEAWNLANFQCAQIILVLFPHMQMLYLFCHQMFGILWAWTDHPQQHCLVSSQTCDFWFSSATHQSYNSLKITSVIRESLWESISVLLAEPLGIEVHVQVSPYFPMDTLFFIINHYKCRTRNLDMLKCWPPNTRGIIRMWPDRVTQFDNLICALVLDCHWLLQSFFKWLPLFPEFIKGYALAMRWWEVTFSLQLLRHSLNIGDFSSVGLTNVDVERWMLNVEVLDISFWLQIGSR